METNPGAGGPKSKLEDFLKKPSTWVSAGVLVLLLLLTAVFSNVGAPPTSSNLTFEQRVGNAPAPGPSGLMQRLMTRYVGGGKGEKAGDVALGGTGGEGGGLTGDKPADGDKLEGFNGGPGEGLAGDAAPEETGADGEFKGVDGFGGSKGFSLGAMPEPGSGQAAGSSASAPLDGPGGRTAAAVPPPGTRASRFGASGGAGGRQVRTALNRSAVGPGNNRSFLASGQNAGGFAAGGAAGARTAAGSAGGPLLTDGGGGAAISGGGVNVGGGGGVTNTGPTDNNGGDGGGGNNDNNGPGNQTRQIADFGAAADDFAAQEPLVRGRGFVLCLIKAFKIRYTTARNTIDSMTTGVDRAAAHFRALPAPRVAATLGEFHKELVSTTGLRTRFRNSVDRLAHGENCFPLDQDPAAVRECYERLENPIRGRDLIVKEMDGFVQLIRTEGAAAMATLPPGDADARAFLQNELKSYESSINSAKAEITGLRWGNEQEVLTLSNQFYRHYEAAKARLNDIDPAGVPEADRAGFETAARNANLSLEKANTAWIALPAQAAQHDKLVKFIEAHRETQNAANDLAEVSIALKLRPAPPPGRSPSPQLPTIENIPVSSCDPPPPPPPGGGKK